MQPDALLIDGRYLLQEKLGEGGMGSVFRAADRLTGEVVALKQINVSADQLHFASFTDTTSDKAAHIALAHEFQTLASLRHPHIINVLDYGFSGGLRPYFTMSYLAGARTLTEARAGQTSERCLNLALQCLQALSYLHRQNILHRDLKPGNVLVIGDHVLVVDFGLAIKRDASQAPAGTLMYMAPEVITGRPAEVASDLYAVGVMLYELFAGRHPFDIGSDLFLDQVWREPPNLERLQSAGSDVAAVIGRLLAKQPEDRYASAAATMEALCRAAGLALPEESPTIRESFLQAAQFVGREAEMSRLLAGLDESRDWRGAAWLVGGTSGVGKSRLVHELRTRALVGGMLVLKGQATLEGTVRYQVWREPLRRLVLAAGPDDDQAGVLKPLAPDLEQLLGRPVPDAPPLEGPAAQQRLLSVIVELFRRQPRPALLILEDLHWATDESLAIFRQLLRVVGELPLVIVGSYRTEEQPDLPEMLPGATVLTLEPLPASTMVDLSVSMLGDAGRQPEILSFLQRETEGNAFFLVEVVRALAEEAGQLSQVGQMVLPETVFPEGVRSVVQRRLARIPAWARPLLSLLAVAGRQIDTRLLPVLDPKTDMERWLTICVNAAVIELRDGEWRLAHDKLREGLLAELADRRPLHRRVAEAVETVYPDDPDHAGALAYHWGAAGRPDKERTYAHRAGVYAATQFANDEAIHYFSRALELAPADDLVGCYALLLAREKVYDLLGRRDAQAADLAALETLAGHMATEQQAEITLRQANYAYVTDNYQAAVAYLQAMTAQAPGSQKQAHLAAAAYLLWGKLLYDQTAYPAAEEKFAQAHALALQGGTRQEEWQSLSYLGAVSRLRGHYDQAQAHFHYLAAVGRESGDLPAEMSGLYGLGEVAEYQGQMAEAQAYFEQGLLVCQKMGHRLQEAQILLKLAIIAGKQYDYDTAQAYYGRIMPIYQETGNRTGQGFVLNNLGFLSWQLGRYDAARELCEQSLAIYQDLNAKGWIGIAEINLGHVERDLGHYAAAQAYYQAALAIFREMDEVLYMAHALNGLGVVAGDVGDAALSEKFHQEALAIRRATNFLPHVMEDLAGIALARLDQGRLAEAREYLAEVLAYLAENPTLAGAERPLQVYLICYRVLAAVGENEPAWDILTQAFHWLQEVAARLMGKTARQLFLENIPTHRAIVAAYEKGGQ